MDLHRAELFCHVAEKKDDRVFARVVSPMDRGHYIQLTRTVVVNGEKHFVATTVSDVELTERSTPESLVDLLTFKLEALDQAVKDRQRDPCRHADDGPHREEEENDPGS